MISLPTRNPRRSWTTLTLEKDRARPSKVENCRNVPTDEHVQAHPFVQAGRFIAHGSVLVKGAPTNDKRVPSKLSRGVWRTHTNKIMQDELMLLVSVQLWYEKRYGCSLS